MTSQNEKRRRLTGRNPLGPFLRLPKDLMAHENFRLLSPRATKLLVDIGFQYNGKNNGDLSAPLSAMKTRGWNSSDQLFKARKELVSRGLILVARQGGLNLPTLYALTWFPIDECAGKLDVQSTRVASNDWRRSASSSSGSNRSRLDRPAD